MSLEETSEAIEEAVRKNSKLVDLKTLITGGLVALVSVVIALYATDRVRSTEIQQLSEQVGKMEGAIERLDVTIQNRATVEEVDKARASSVRRANAYTDTQIGQLRPVLTRLNVVLERLDEDRKEAKDERRLIQTQIQELKNSLRHP